MTPHLTHSTGFWKRCLIALSVSTLLFAGQIRMYSEEQNRFFTQWERADGIGLVLSILLIAAICVIGSEIFLRGKPRFARVGKSLFILLLTHGFLALVPLDWSSLQKAVLSGVSWLLAGLLIAHAWQHERFPVVRWAANLSLILSPFAFIVFFQVLTYPAWRNKEHTDFLEVIDGVRDSRAQSTPVFLFIFDEWSYDRSFTDHEFNEDLPNLKALARKSAVFHQAHSAAKNTFPSVPRLLFQRTNSFRYKNGTGFWVETDELENEIWEPSVQADSLLLRAQNAGYITALAGFYLPYGRMFGDQLDGCVSYDLSPRGKSIPGRIAHYQLDNFKFWNDPLSFLVRRAFYSNDTIKPRAVYSRHWFEITLDLQRLTLKTIRQAPENFFGVFHLTMPHAPYVFQADGSFAGTYENRRGGPNLEGYKTHLRYMDRCVGEIVDALHTSGKFDGALIILTSDHTWRHDPDLKRHVKPVFTHVPLLVKMPHQTDTLHHTNRIETMQIGELFNEVLSGAAKGPDISTILTRLEEQSAIDAAKQPGDASPN